MEIIKEKKNTYKIHQDNEEIKIPISDWYCHYGNETYKSKNIINLNLKDDNNGYNIKNIILSIYKIIQDSETLIEFKDKYFLNPIRKNKYGIETIRIEIDKLLEVEKKEHISGTIVIKNIWLWNDSYGLKLTLE